MQARKIMEAMGISPFGPEVNKLRELIRFHLTMGASEAEIPKLVEQKANDVRVLQQGTLSERKKQAVQFMWQRYRDQWPVATAAYKAKSKSGYTNYYYYSVGDFEAPPGWRFIVHGTVFAITQAHNLREILVTRAGLLAEFMPEPEKHSVEVTTYEPEAISVAEIATEPVILPPKREGKQTQTKTRPDQFSVSVQRRPY
ncbi:hypothetical protein HX773_20285 [Pantoea sp. B9002]|uniref:hypothetical protein n=1 Tax=Pantoea sp. B9002 TaxID=2726979 RepID=UPI0015A0745D|nr:hypothetical protein [Pantoea sp. B9002]NWA63249.1 hypothetical protein [Pantoea sp. B9002]